MATVTDNKRMGGYAYMVIAVVIAITAVGGFAVARSRRHAAAARAKARVAEAELLATAQELSRGHVAPEVVDPEREAQKARVAAAWEDPEAGRKAWEEVKNSQFNAPPPGDAAPLLPSAPPPPMAAPLFGATPTMQVAGALSMQLRDIADRVDAITTSNKSDAQKSEEIIVLVARSWAALPLNQLENNQAIR